VTVAVGRQSRRIPRAITAVGALALVINFAGCSPATAPSATPIVPASALPSPSPGGSGPSASGSPSASGGIKVVTIEPDLLDLLPAEVNGIRLEPQSEAAAEIAASPVLSAQLDALNVAAAIDAATNDFVVATVQRPLPGLFSDEWFRDWRDTFDESVCAQAGGVDGHAQTEIDGRTVFIATCKGGNHTYAVWLPDKRVIIQLNANGDKRLGEELLKNLP
jgi:hypothetical protein